MRQYETSLDERIYSSAKGRRLYRENPAYRLKAINRNRISRGLEPYERLEQAQLRID